MKVLLHVPLSPYSGYGNDGIGMVQAFLRRGDDVYLQPTSMNAPLPPEIAELLTKELVPPFDLHINHVDPAGLSSSETLSNYSGLSVGWTMWEYTNLRNMDPRDLEDLEERLDDFDALVGYSDIDVVSLGEYFDGPIIQHQGGFDPEGWPLDTERDWDTKEFYFFMIGVLSERKDPYVAIDAFHRAQAEDEEFRRWARLSLKTTSPGLHSKIEDVNRQVDETTGEEYTTIRVFYDIWPTDLVRKFYTSQHVLLAPSRGEGKNMPALEFMSTGGTVIATNWAGHKVWLNPDYSYPLDYSLEPESIEHLDTLNARADVEHLKELLLHTFRNRDEVRAKGQRAAAAIPKSHSWDVVVQNLLLKLRTVSDRGEQLWEASRIKPIVPTYEEAIEIRCPVGAKRLLGKALRQGGVHITPGNLLEFACADCRKLMTHRGERVSRVLHRFDLLGRLVETGVVR